MKVWILDGPGRMEPRCGVRFDNPRPESPVREFHCTLAIGHDGPHVAHLSGGGASPAIAIAFE